MSNSTPHTLTRPVRLAIIGHTNTGKTSLMRTLLRDDAFGEVADASATTRHVAEVTLYDDDDRPLVALYDTPGLEDPTGLMDYLAAHTSERDDGIVRLRYFLSQVDAAHDDVSDFSQEAKAIRALLDADIGIYVIDARLMPTHKYKDELQLLVHSAVPILPVFNYTRHTEHMPAWQDMLSRRALHIANHFDTVAFDFASEVALWQHLASLSGAALANTSHPFMRLLKLRDDAWQNLLEAGNLIIADFLVNVAAFSQKIAEDVAPAPILQHMQAAVRTAEKIAMQRLMHLYKFYHSPLEITDVSIELQSQDPFDKQLLTHYGIRSASAGTAGALIGAGIDVATLGTSLGLGTVMGGLIGGGLANAGAIKDKLQGLQQLYIDDASLLVLAHRLNTLHATLRQTGHAHTDALQMCADIQPWQALPKSLAKARSKPHYSSLSTLDISQSDNAHYDDKHALRLTLIDKLMAEKFAQ